MTGSSETSCATCGATMPAGEARCPTCGTTRGEEHRCPFCRTIAVPEADPIMRWRCPVCGAPRIPHAGAASTEEALAHLKAARSARSSQIVWKTSGFLGLGFGILALLVMTGVFAIVSPPFTAMFAGYLLAFTPLIFAALAWKKSKSKGPRITNELDAAWFDAAKDLLGRRGMTRASELAEALKISQAEAETLLLRLASQDDVRPDVTEGGDLAVSLRPNARVRVQAEPAAEPVEEPAAAGESDGKGKAGA